MDSTRFTKDVSQLIATQFPDVYREEGAELVAFTKAYYEFLESDIKYSHKLGRQLFDIKDIDRSLEDFVANFKATYLADFPFAFKTDKRFAIKHITDFYRTKGSKQSLQLLMKMLFSEDVDVYYPGEDVIKPSDSNWYKPYYLEVTKSTRTKTYLNEQITGTKSGAKAFVESITRKRVKGKVFDVLYLSDLRGTFAAGERITNDGVIRNAPRIKGSLSALQITLGGRNNKVGDIFDVVTEDGLQGKVKVTGIVDATGRVDFEIVDGGWGYGYTTDGFTDVYVSDALMFVDNPNQDFIMFEKLYQPVERVEVISASDVLGNYVIGDYLTGKNGATLVANGVIVAVANTDANGAITGAATTNGTITVQTTEGTFTDQRLLQMTANVRFRDGEYVTEESKMELQFINKVGNFSVAEKVEQIIREPIGNTIISYAFGTVTVANTSLLVLEPAWGIFSTTANVVCRGVTSNATCKVTSVNIPNSFVGARGRVTEVVGNTVTVNVIFGSFDTGKKVRGDGTKVIHTISTNTITGATVVYLRANNTSNGVLTVANDDIREGMFMGQNTSAIGIFGNNAPFFYSNTYPSFILTRREDLVSPPRYANNAIINKTVEINRIAGGHSANFNITVLEDIQENVTIYPDIIGDNNVAGVKYLNVRIDGRYSGVGFVASVVVNAGGTGYGNGQSVAFEGGGYANGDPLVFANGFVTTNTTGGITTVTVDVNGETYYDDPTITIGGGTGANLVPVMDFGYGFPKNPNAENLNLIGDCLISAVIDIGSIGLLGNINPGADYTADPFVKVQNKYVSSYKRSDLILVVANTSGGNFAVDEEITQYILGTTTYKGRIKYTNIVNGAGTIGLERQLIGIAFDENYPLIGSRTGARATLINFYSDPTSEYIGNNAVITGTTISASGIATKLEIASSGFGYIQDGPVELRKEGNPFIITATSKATKEGISSGYWRTTNSHLNSEKKIHDNKYYQEYSYDVISGLSLNRYASIVNKAFHVAGMKMFGSVTKNSNIDGKISIANSVITVT